MKTPNSTQSAAPLWGFARSLRLLIASLTLGGLVAANAVITPLPDGFKTRVVQTAADTEIYVRSGGTGPAVVLLHGYGDTGDMWGPMAVELARDHFVIIPDLRGMGQSSHPAGGYDKKTQAGDLR